MWVLDTLYSLLGNWLRDHTCWALSGIGVKIKSLRKNFWSSVLNFTTPRYAFLFSNSETYIVHVINFEWSRSVNFSTAYVLYAIRTFIFPIAMTLSIVYFILFYYYTFWVVTVKYKAKFVKCKGRESSLTTLFTVHHMKAH